MSSYRNRVLDAFSLLTKPDAVPVRSVVLQAGQVVGQSGFPMEFVYMPGSALISSVVGLGTGESIDGVLVGCEGIFGAFTAFGLEAPAFSNVVQRSGTCWTMRIPDLRRLVHEKEEAAALLFRYQHYLLAQAQQLIACATKHHIRARFCSYLLRVQEEGGEVKLIQEHLARTLGVQRTSVSLVAGDLQGQGLIRYQRGRIRILDFERLRGEACECFGTIEMFKRTLLQMHAPPLAAASQ